MNSLKGLGVCVVLAGIAYALTRVADTDTLMLWATVVIISVSLVTYAASIRRRRRDHRIAGD
ncbi:hypothetical protein ACFU99_02810 [Streptomyces sp. NPDC057654]|uniref:hypothetical protein n=1 Tax=Streptomyces sp. NPDC057654 TaxID=3346196 RepID=UPI003678B3F3